MTFPDHIETERLQLRFFQQEDAPHLQEILNDRRLEETTVNIVHPFELDHAEQWIEQAAEKIRNGTFYNYAAVRLSDGQLVGRIGLRVYDYYCEYGFWFGARYWNQGLCTEAAKVLMQEAFQNLGVQVLKITHFIGNRASGQVARKLGMRHEGRLEAHVRKGDLLKDVDQYAISRDEWLQMSQIVPTPSS